MVPHYFSCNNANYMSGKPHFLTFRMVLCLSVKSYLLRVQLSRFPSRCRQACTDPLVFAAYEEPLVVLQQSNPYVQGPPGWLAGTLVLLQTRRGLTLYERVEKTTMRDLFGFIFSRAVFTVLRRLHDVPPQTFIRPPMMAAFHCLVLPRVDV